MSPSSRSHVRLLPYLALVLIHVLSGLEMEQPLILADELGYLGNARYLAGTAHLPNMLGHQFYHFGYSLLIVPAFWLFSDPVASYRTAIVINSLLIAALFFPLRYLLVSILEVPEKTARWIAFACCLYPPLLLYSSYAWSESAFILFHVSAAALFARYLASGSSRDLLVFSLAAGFLYTIHPRALPVLAAILLYLVVSALLRVLPPRQLLLSAATMAAIFALTRAVNGHLKTIGWAGGGEVSAARLAGRLLPGSDLVGLLERAAGQVLYLFLSTYGLFVLGVAAMLGLILRKLASGSPRRVLAEPATGVSLFILLTAAGVLAASCTLKLYSLHGPYGLRGANFIHGRYNEAFAVFGIAFGLADYCRRRLRNRQIVRRAAVVIAATVCLTAVVMTEIGDALERQAASNPGFELREQILPPEVDAIAVPGVYPFVELVGALDLWAISAAAIAIFLTLTLLVRFSNRTGIALLVILFGFFSIYNYTHYLESRIRRARSRLTFVSNVGRFDPLSAISFDAAHRERGFIPGLQYLMPDTVFDRFDSREDQMPASEAVIAGAAWRQARRLGARFAMASGGGSVLWFLPGELQSRLPATSFEGVTLGAARDLAFRESGFHGPESFAGEPGRWTTGDATLRVPVDPGEPPVALHLETMVPGRDGARLRLLANGTELWNGSIPGDPWSRTFSLKDVPLADELLIELRSDTFSPVETVPESTDGRKLGVVVRGIRLTARKGRVFD